MEILDFEILDLKIFKLLSNMLVSKVISVLNKFLFQMAHILIDDHFLIIILMYNQLYALKFFIISKNLSTALHPCGVHNHQLTKFHF